MGAGGAGAALFSGLVCGLSGGRDTAGTLAGRGSAVAYALCKAQVKADGWDAAGGAGACFAVQAGTGDEWRSGSREPAVAGVWTDCDVSHAGVWRGHGGQETASRTFTEGIGEDEDSGGRVRVRGRHARGPADGQGGGSARDCSAGTISDGSTAAGGGAGVFVEG